MADDSQSGGVEEDDSWELGPASGPGALSGVYSDDRAVDEGGELSHPFDTTEPGRYRGAQLIGWGGMGRVSSVTDTRLRREVALKEVVAEGAEGRALERRLAQEAWISARLDHPGIVAVHDAGRAPDGRLFFTMRLIRGRSLASALSGGGLSRGALLRHLLAACQAMGYAHSEGVLHRDLKPANIMLGDYGDTQVVDWGLACMVGAVGDTPRADEAIPADLAARTMAGSIVGTPAYMSPEQARGEPADPRSDVWSLGAVAFEIVAGHALFEGSDGTGILQRLTRGDIRVRGAEGAKRAADRSPELWAIIEHALAVEPVDRYADARALADDLAAYLDDRLVAAYDYSPLDMARRFIRAFKLPLGVAAVAIVSLALVGWVSYSATLEERDRAREAERTASQARRAAELSQATMLVQRAQDAATKGARAEAELLAAHALRIRPSAEARGVLAQFGVTPAPTLSAAMAPPSCHDSSLSPDGTRLVCVEPDGTSVWQTDPLEPLWQSPVILHLARFAGDDLLITWRETADLRTTCLLMHAGTGTPLGTCCNTLAADHSASAAGVTVSRVLSELTWRTHRTGECRTLPLDTNSVHGISGDGRRAVVHTIFEEEPLLVDLVQGTLTPFERPFAPLVESTMSVGLDGRGTRAAMAGTEGSLLVLSLPTGQVMWRVPVADRALSEVAWSPDDQWIATADERGWVTVHSSDGLVHQRLPRVEAREITWRRRGDQLELVTLGSELRIYTIPPVRGVNRYVVGAGLAHVGIDGTGSRLALPDALGAVTVVHVETGVVQHRLEPGPSGVAKTAVFDLASPERIWATRMGTLGMIAFGEERGEVTGHGPFKRLASIAGGGALGATYGRTIVRAATPQQGEAIIEHPSYPAALRDLEGGHGGRVAATLTVDGQVRMWRPAATHADARQARLVLRDPAALVLGIDEHGRRIATASREDVRVFRTADGTELMATQVVESPIEELAMSADGERIAVGLRNGAAHVLRTSDGAVLAVMTGHSERVAGLGFSPDGRWLVTVSWDATARRWDLTELARPAGELVSEVESRWGLGLAHATSVDLR